jgi:hypothetical protein
MKRLWTLHIAFIPTHWNGEERQGLGLSVKVSRRWIRSNETVIVSHMHTHIQTHAHTQTHIITCPHTHTHTCTHKHVHKLSISHPNTYTHKHTQTITFTPSHPPPHTHTNAYTHLLECHHCFIKAARGCGADTIWGSLLNKWLSTLFAALSLGSVVQIVWKQASHTLQGIRVLFSGFPNQ